MCAAGRVAGRVAIVTGASRGNGRSIALGLAREGADVAVNYLRRDGDARRVVSEIEGLGRRGLAVQADVRQRGDVVRMVDFVAGELGPINILVNNAGILARRAFLELTDDDWDETLNSDLRSAFIVSQTVANKMKASGGGSIVNVSSILQILGAKGLAHYCVAKAGLGMLTKVMALELAVYGIRVNAVCPGTILTDINREDAARPDWVDAQMARLAVPRLGTPEDIVGAVLFLASDESRMAVGTSLILDNGKSAW